MPKNLIILGSTGSVGRQVLKVIKDSPKFKVIGLSGFQNEKLLKEQIKKFSVKYFSLPGTNNAKFLPADRHGKIQNLKLEELAALKKADVVINAIVGEAGLKATLSAIKAGKDVYLANKESMVIAGSQIMRLAKKHKVTIIPLDSELNAIWQCVKTEKHKSVKAVYLTCSGGALYAWPKKKLQKATVKDVLKHPIWKMGRKITVDSATLMNKGFEVIETAHFFNLKAEQIKVLIHRQSIVHALVEFTDGTTKAILYKPDMSTAISAALYAPDRQLRENIEISKVLLKQALSFSFPDLKKFPCLKLAYRALEMGKNYPKKLVRANDEAVSKFLAGKIKFTDISKLAAKIFT